MKKIWTEDVVEFEGQFYNIPRSIIEPKPLQKPHIPIYLGGYVPRTFARIATHAEGWVAAISGPIDFLKHGINTLKEEAQKIGKNSKDFKNTVLVVPQIASSPILTNNNSNTTEKLQNHLNANGISQFPFCGTVEQIAKDIQEIKHIGFDQIVFGFANLEFDKVIDTARELSKFAK